jgi:hypothetical protein
MAKSAVSCWNNDFGNRFFKVATVVGDDTVAAQFKRISFASVADDAVGADGLSEWQICQDFQSGLPWRERANAIEAPAAQLLVSFSENARIGL